MIILFTVLMFCFVGRLIGLAFKLTWGITKVACSIFFLPIVLIVLAFSGLLYIALPVLIILGIVSLVAPKRRY